MDLIKEFQADIMRVITSMLVYWYVMHLYREYLFERP